MDCLFCKIIKGEIPSSRVYEDESVIAFHDIQPQAPVHVLIIPRSHISSVDEINEENAAAAAAVLRAVPRVAAAAGLKNGYRVITNCGEDGCQSVKHLHFHVLGGKKLTETMG